MWVKGQMAVRAVLVGYRPYSPTSLVFRHQDCGEVSLWVSLAPISRQSRHPYNRISSLASRVVGRSPVPLYRIGVATPGVFAC